MLDGSEARQMQTLEWKQTLVLVLFACSLFRLWFLSTFIKKKCISLMEEEWKCVCVCEGIWATLMIHVKAVVQSLTWLYDPGLGPQVGQVHVGFPAVYYGVGVLAGSIGRGPVCHCHLRETAHGCFLLHSGRSRGTHESWIICYFGSSESKQVKSNRGSCTGSRPRLSQ